MPHMFSTFRLQLYLTMPSTLEVHDCFRIELASRITQQFHLSSLCKHFSHTKRQDMMIEETNKSQDINNIFWLDNFENIE